MAIDRIEFMLTTKAVWPVPPDAPYHWPLMDMHQAYALEAALQAKGDYFGWIQRATHPVLYPEPNPNPYREKGINPYQGLVGFRFEVNGTTDISEAYRLVYDDIITPIIGTNYQDIEFSEVMVSRTNVKIENRYHPLYNPTGI